MQLAIFKNTYDYLVPKTRKFFSGMCILTLLTAFAEIGAASAVSFFSLVMATPDAVREFAAIQWIAAQFPKVTDIMNEPAAFVGASLLLIAVAVGVKSLMQVATFFMQQVLAERAARDISTALFKCFLSQPYTFFLQENTAELQTELSWNNIFRAFTSNCLAFIVNLLIAVLLLCTSLYIAPVASCIVFSVVALVALAVTKVLRPMINHKSTVAKDLFVEANKVSLCGVQGIKDVKIHQRQQAFYKTYFDLLTKRTTHQALAQTFAQCPTFILEVSGISMLFVSHLVLVYLETPLPKLVLSISLLGGVAWRLLPAVNKTVHALGLIRIYLPYMEKVLSRLDGGREFPTCEKPVPFERSISFRNLRYTYPDTAAPALHGLSLDIFKGQMVGFIGKSGAGKSTLIGVLAGLLPVEKGLLYIDDETVSSEQVACWSKNVGYIPQSPYLMDGTLADNIGLSDYGNAIDRERVQRCCQMAAIDFLDQLDEGLDTVIGERGARLSGGQAQRVAIARALYNEPEVLLFDEATSALDGASEQAIQETILSLKQELTLVIIAHRLSTVRACDRVYWIEDGTVVMAGASDKVVSSYEAKQQAQNET